MLLKKLFAIVIITLALTTNAIALNQIEPKNLITEDDRNFPICRTMEPVLQEPIPANTLKPQTLETPSQFSWTNYNGDWTTPARYQGNCGSCWAFAAVGVIESAINIMENNPRLDPDLSEQYILSCLSSAGSCRGGSATRAIENIIDDGPNGNYCNGIILESCMPYEADDDIACEEKSSDWQDKLVPLLDFEHYYSISEEGGTLKSCIFENGPVITTMYASDDFTSWGMLNHASDQYYPYNGPCSWSNHVVIIVGWKDDPTIGNGGYWICKNSWSPFWANNGFFNIEYGALNIDNGKIAWVNYDPGSFDWPPVASTNGMRHGDVFEHIAFSAANSFDVEGEITDFTWDFGDGFKDTGIAVTHEYNSKGIYNVSLTVTDETGQQNTVNSAVFVDIWSTGNDWEYFFDNIEFSLIQGQTEISLEAVIPSINFKIDKETTETYIMKFSGTIDADISLQYSSIDILAQLSKTIISGEIIFSKRNHSIKQVECNIDGKIILPEILPIPFSFKSDISFEFNPDLKYINYPLYDKKEYDNPSTELTINGDVSSPLLNIINFVNKIASFFKIELIPEEFGKFLPVVRFEEVLDDLIDTNNLIIPTITDLLVSEVSTTVPSGTYNAYEISSNWGGSMYYSHEVENIIKIDISPSSISTTSGNVNLAIRGELIDTNYE